MASASGHIKRIITHINFQILMGILIGLGIGFYIPRDNELLTNLANTFVNIYQIPLIPYVFLSIIVGVGSMSGAMAKTLFFKLIKFILVAWVIFIMGVLAVKTVFQVGAAGGEQAYSAVVGQQSQASFSDMFIPSNIFYTLSQSYIPGIVIFSLLLGGMLIQIKHKESILSIFRTLLEVLDILVAFLIRIFPISIMLVVGHGINISSPKQLELIGIYIISILLMILFIGAWIVPWAIKSFTKLKLKNFISEIAPPYFLALVMGDTLIAVPAMIRAVKRIVSNHLVLPEDEDFKEPKILVPFMFNIPLATLNNMLFIFFAAYLYNIKLTLLQILKLCFTGPITLFGDSWVAMPSLLQNMQLPSDAFGLYASISIFTNPFNESLNTICIMTITTLVLLSVHNRFYFDSKRLLKFIIPSALIWCGVLAIAHVLSNHAPAIEQLAEALQEEHADIASLRPTHEVKQIVNTSPNKNLQLRNFEKIIKSGKLRVGYHGDNYPFCYFDKNNKLKGYDVFLIHKLASDLDVTLEFYPYSSYQTFLQDLNKGSFDMAVCGLTITSARLRDAHFSTPTLEGQNAFLVKDYKADDVKEYNELRKNKKFNLGVISDSVYERIAKILLPYAHYIFIHNKDDIAKHPEIDAILYEAKAGTAWIMKHPRYTVVVPKPAIGRQYYGWAIAKQHQHLLAYINSWLKLNEFALKSQQEQWFHTSNEEENKQQ